MAKQKKIFNWFERFVIRRIAKKIVNKIPELRNQGFEIIEEKTPELLNNIHEKIEETIFLFIEKHKNK